MPEGAAATRPGAAGLVLPALLPQMGVASLADAVLGGGALLVAAAFAHRAAARRVPA